MAAFKLTLDNLPRTIDLVRMQAGAFPCEAPVGFPVLIILDQTRLPDEESYEYLCDWHEVIDAIKELQVRGAPAIGIAGAAAVAMCAAELAEGQSSAVAFDAAEDGRAAFDAAAYQADLARAADAISHARPTAVNLMWACQQALSVAQEHLDAGDGAQDISDALFDYVQDLVASDEATNRAIGQNGATLLGQDSTVLTHCNAGSLGTAFFGTALGIVYAAAEQGKIARVYADETRPVGQGARLTTWELSRAGVPVTLICDDMAAYVMATNKVDAVLVGADRITANGDVANKIGTYGVAILAQYHDVPFYVAAPTSTIDFSLAAGKDIPIEQRDAGEVLARPLDGVDVLNPAFDVTPAHLVDKIITECGVFTPGELAGAYGHKSADGQDI